MLVLFIILCTLALTTTVISTNAGFTVEGNHVAGNYISMVASSFFGIPPSSMRPTPHILGCFDSAMNLDGDALIHYLAVRRRGEAYSDLEEDSLPPKRPRRDYVPHNYDPDESRNSKWYRDYALGNRFAGRKGKRARQFRRRFRMPLEQFRELIQIIRTENWFPMYEKPDATGRLGVPLELLVLGALRYLGRGWTFDDIEESTSISEETHRVFFRRFVAAERTRISRRAILSFAILLAISSGVGNCCCNEGASRCGLDHCSSCA
jgi:hypothetical protein